MSVDVLVLLVAWCQIEPQAEMFLAMEGVFGFVLWIGGGGGFDGEMIVVPKEAAAHGNKDAADGFFVVLVVHAANSSLEKLVVPLAPGFLAQEVVIVLEENSLALSPSEQFEVAELEDHPPDVFPSLNANVVSSLDGGVDSDHESTLSLN